MQTSGSCAILLRHLCFGHVLQKLHGLLGSTEICRSLAARRRAHHHESLPWLGIEGGQRGVILELASLDQHFLSVWLNTSQGKQLVLQGFAIRSRIELDVVAFAGVLDNDWMNQQLESKDLWLPSRLTRYSCHVGESPGESVEVGRRASGSVGGKHLRRRSRRRGALQTTQTTIITAPPRDVNSVAAFQHSAVVELVLVLVVDLLLSWVPKDILPRQTSPSLHYGTSHPHSRPWGGMSSITNSI